MRLPRTFHSESTISEGALKDTAEHSLGETSPNLTAPPLDLDATTIARFAKIVGISSAEGRTQFTEVLKQLRNDAQKKAQSGIDHQRPARRANADISRFEKLNRDVVKAGRQFIRALEARREVDPTGGRQELEDLVKREVDISSRLSRVKPGRPRSPLYNTEFERLVGRLMASITEAGGQPTLTRHHRGGRLVKLLIAFRPYLPAGFIPEDTEKWRWARLERLKTEQKRRRSATSSSL
jgi:hypothetical protein